MKKFYLYLLNKNLEFVKRDELEAYYSEFKDIWKLKQEFKQVLNALNKTNITYLIDGWYALSKENSLLLISKLFSYLNIPNYYGLETAKYLNRISWQTPSTFLLINTKFSRTRIINNTKIKFVRFPKILFSKNTLIENKLVYSDIEKTVLDLIFWRKKLDFKPQDFDKINFYLSLYANFPEVKAILINSLTREDISKIR